MLIAGCLELPPINPTLRYLLCGAGGSRFEFSSRDTKDERRVDTFVSHPLLLVEKGDTFTSVVPELKLELLLDPLVTPALGGLDFQAPVELLGFFSIWVLITANKSLIILGLIYSSTAPSIVSAGDALISSSHGFIF